MRVLAVAVHPDDEVLGCGGTLLKHAQNGDSLHWLLITSMAEDNYSPREIATQRRQVQYLREHLPFETFDWLRLPTATLDQFELNTFINLVREPIIRVRPEIVYLQHWSDAHSDHRVTFDAVMSVLKSFYMRDLGVRRVLACETISETDAAPPHVRAPFIPNVFVDIEATIERKLDLFKIYEDQVHKEPGPRSLSAIRAQARARGASVNCSYAEAFMLVRELL